MWYKSLATATLFPASAKQWASPGTNFTSLGRPGQEKALPKKYEGDSPLPAPTLVPAAYTQPLCPRQQAPGLPAGPEELPGLPALHMPDKIMDVFCTASSNEPAPTKTLGKKCFVLVWQHTLGRVVQAPPCTPSGGKEGAGLTPQEEESLNEKPSKEMQKKYPERKRTPGLAVSQRSGFSQASFLPAWLQDQAGVAQQRAMC